MKSIVPFSYENHEIRVATDKQGNPWWVAKDVCEILGLKNITEALLSLDRDEKSTIANPEVDSNTKGLRAVNEPGLYTLIFKSRKPEAKRFKRWVAHEVLPQIRMTGRYEMPGMGLTGEASEQQNTIQYSVTDLCQEADKYLGGKAALTALNYFTGMPVDDLMDELESKKESNKLALVHKPSTPSSVVEFVTSYCVLSSEAEVTKTDLYSGYEGYCKERDIYNVGYDSFFRSLYQLTQVRNVRRRIGGKRIWRLTGICLKINREMEVVS